VAVQTFIARIDDGGQQVAAVQKDPDIRKVDRVYALGQGTRILKAGI
jgi:hypothetical protein